MFIPLLMLVLFDQRLPELSEARRLFDTQENPAPEYMFRHTGELFMRILFPEGRTDLRYMFPATNDDYVGRYIVCQSKRGRMVKNEWRAQIVRIAWRRPEELDGYVRKDMGTLEAYLARNAWLLKEKPTGKVLAAMRTLRHLVEYHYEGAVGVVSSAIVYPNGSRSDDPTGRSGDFTGTDDADPRWPKSGAGTSGWLYPVTKVEKERTGIRSTR